MFGTAFKDVTERKETPSIQEQDELEWTPIQAGTAERLAHRLYKLQTFDVNKEGGVVIQVCQVGPWIPPEPKIANMPPPCKSVNTGLAQIQYTF